MTSILFCVILVVVLENELEPNRFLQLYFKCYDNWKFHYAAGP